MNLHVKIDRGSHVSEYHVNCPKVMTVLNVLEKFIRNMTLVSLIVFHAEQGFAQHV